MGTTSLRGMGVKVTHIPSGASAEVMHLGDQRLNLLLSVAQLQENEDFQQWWTAGGYDTSEVNPFDQESMLIEVFNQESGQWETL